MLLNKLKVIRRCCAAGLVALALLVLPQVGWAAACEAVFTNGVQSHALGGSVNLQFASEISGGGTVIDTPSLSTQQEVTCGGGSCAFSGSPAAASTPSFVTGTGTRGSFTASDNGNTNILAGDYTSVTVNQDRRITFNSGNDTYLMSSFTSNFRSEVRMRAGDYWINGNLVIGQETEMEKLAGGGPVRIFVNGNVTFGFQVDASDFSPDELLIYATGDVTFANEVEFSGFIYAGGQFRAGFRSEITGGISGATVILDNEVEVEYEGGVLAGVDFAPFCGPAVAPGANLLTHYRMDEVRWDGTTNEVRDASGNNNHGTAMGAAGTASVDPARPGDPGTCGYGVFGGEPDYLSVPNLSTILNNTASLAFWIKTTQTGNDTVWLAPGVTGIEEEGGEDDIFWGWLDGSGRIGLGVGNTGGVRSTESINDGQWRHVVLTRDHQSGEHQVFINGALQNSATNRTGSIGNSYSGIGRVENTGTVAPLYLQAELDEVRVYSGVLSESEVTDIYNAVQPCSSNICPVGTARTGLLGEYFENQNLSGEPAATREDGPINFAWDFDEGPWVLGGRDEDFSIRWEGQLFVTQSDVYRFRTLSDDGVRLWVDGEQVIDNWTLHPVEEDISDPVSLEADQAYDIRLEFFENTGRAEIRLFWSREGAGAGNYTLIPAGTTDESAEGLYHCQDSAVASYTLSHSAVGVTCEAEPVIITARDSAGNPVAPAAGTEIVLEASPFGADTSWLDGNTHVFPGDQVSAIRFLRQTSPASLDLAVTDGVASGASGPIDFTDTALRFYDSRAGNAMLVQVAGETDSQPVLRAVRTDDETGSCLARVANQTRSVNLGYECLDPGTCITGQTLSLSGEAVQGNNVGAAIGYTPINLAFDSEGYADIPFNYTDVGLVRLLGQLDLPEENEQPAITLTGTSNEFVVKPYTLEVIAVEGGAGNANPGTTSGGSGFVASGEPFSVRVQARNANGDATPNFGNEGAPQGAQIELANLVYPGGGSLGSLGGADNFSPEPGGEARNDSLSWDNVGTLRLNPRLRGNDYLGAGDIPVITESDSIGRFYPFDYALAGSSIADACGSFTYMNQAEIQLNYTINARNLFGGVVSNYDNTAQATPYSGTASPSYVAEDDNAGNGNLLSDRVQVDSFTWENGVLIGQDSNAGFLRDNAPDGPWRNLQWGIQLTDPLDGRDLVDLDMNADTTGDCLADNNCSAVRLGNTLDLRFGRLRLNDAYGPEVVDLPVQFFTEYWNGAEFVRNADDNCTRIPREAINYPEGNLVDDSNRTVSIGGGETIGEYQSPDGLDGVGVNFINSDAIHRFTAPGQGNIGSFEVQIDLSERPWLRYDWNQDGNYNDVLMPPARFGFGSYRGHDRIIYWREVLE